MTVSYVNKTNYNRRGLLLIFSTILSVLALFLPLYNIKYFEVVEDKSFFDFLQEKQIIWLSYFGFITLVVVTLYLSDFTKSMKITGAGGLLTGILLFYFIVVGYFKGNEDLKSIEGSVSLSIGFIIYLMSFMIFALSILFPKRLEL